jgi:capsular exopolysaccharide synthesis family protein
MYTDRLMNTYVQIAKSEPVAQELALRVPVTRKPTIDARVIPDTELIEITVVDTNATRAAREANTLAEILVSQKSQLYTGGGTKLTDVLQAQITQVQADMDETRVQYERLLAATPPAPDRIDAAKQLLDLKQTNYAALLNQYEQAKFREQIQEGMITVWQTATVPQKPSQPNPPLNYALGVLAGLVGGLALALVAENLDTTLYSTADIEKIAGRDALVRIPKGNRRQISLAQRDYSPMAEGFRGLAMALHYRERGKMGKAVLIASSEPGQGKSTMALHLAVALAELGKSVIVIDCDARIPRLHTLFRLPNKLGLKDVLEKADALDEVIQPSAYEGVTVLTSGSELARPSHRLGSPEMASLVSKLKHRFDYVLLDSPALLAVADVTALRPFADCVIVVARRGHSTRDGVRAAGRLLSDVSDKPAYLVVNQAEATESYGYYEYRAKPGSLSMQFQEMMKPRKKPSSREAIKQEPPGQDATRQEATRLEAAKSE